MLRTVEDATKGFLSNPKLKASTLSQYRFTCNRHILPYFKDTELSRLNNEVINGFIQEKINSIGLHGKPLSPKTINDITCLLVQIIRNHSQFDIDIKKPRHRQEEISVFAKDEYDRLKTYLSIETDSKKLGIIIAMLTGLRIGELCALKWENIDLENGAIFIDKTIQRIKSTDTTVKAKTRIIIDAPKSIASIRAIPTPLVLLTLLKGFQASNSSYVLTNTTKFIEPRVYQRHFKGYLKACNVRSHKFHALRHTFATMAISKGIDIKTLSMLLGHTDVSFTMRRYVHPNMEHKRIQIEKLAVGF